MTPLAPTLRSLTILSLLFLLGAGCGPGPAGRTGESAAPPAPPPATTTQPEPEPPPAPPPPAPVAEPRPAAPEVPPKPPLTAPTRKAIYSGNPARKAVALLVNIDWGDRELAEMLAILKAERVRVTFFPSGTFAEKHPALMRQAVQDGHEMATHGYDLSQGPLALAAAGRLQADIARSVEVIQRASGGRVDYYAPHMSEVSPELVDIAHGLGLRFILYTVDTIDWQKSATPELIFTRAARARAGDFVLMHPMPNTLAALKQIIAHFRAQGLQLLTVSEVLAEER